jgi:hypothetical protein
MQPEVSMRDFAGLCRQRKYGIDYLVEQFAGKFGCADGMARETTRQFFERLQLGRSAANVIPFRCLIEFYQRELGYLQDATGEERRCACGCGQHVFGRKKWAAASCKQRAYRQRIGDGQNGRKKPASMLTPTVTKSRKTTRPLSDARNVTEARA